MNSEKKIAFRMLGDEENRWRSATTFNTPVDALWIEVYVGTGRDSVMINTDHILEYFMEDIDAEAT